MSARAGTVSGFALSTGIRCPKCGGGDLWWLAMEGKPVPDPVTCRCGDCEHRWQEPRERAAADGAIARAVKA